MRPYLLAAALLAFPALAAASPADPFAQCRERPLSSGPYGDGSPAGELFALYAEEINPAVLIFPEEAPLLVTQILDDMR